jgi:two-component system, sensor histidine kinase LadS
MQSLRWLVFACLCGSWGQVVAADDVAPPQPPTLSAERQLPQAIDLAKLKLSAQSTLAFDVASMQVLEDVPLDATLAQVASAPEGAFRAFNPAHTYSLSPKKALWLHFRVMSQPDDLERWSFEFPKPYVDGVQFYYKNPEGQWVTQSAGKLTNPGQWPMRGLYPRFELPPARGGIQDVYVKVLQVVPIRVNLHLKRLNDSNFELEKKLFLYGLLIGLLVLMSVFGLVLAVAYRQIIYVWYSMYAAVACFSAANYLGFVNYFVWPDSMQWLKSPIFVTIIIATTLKMQFCRLMFLRDVAARWLNRAVWVALAISIACVAGLLVLPSAAVGNRIALFFIALTCVTAILILMIGLSIYKGNKLAWLWVLASLPLTLLLLLTAVEGMGLVNLHTLPYDAVVYARTFEVVVLLFTVQMHVKSLHERTVRTRTLKDLDPLTGFLIALQYPDTLAHLWSQARSNRQDMAIAYVCATVDPNAYQAANQPTDDEMVLRCVRMLRMVIRRDDTVPVLVKMCLLC